MPYLRLLLLLCLVCALRAEDKPPTVIKTYDDDQRWRELQQAHAEWEQWHADKWARRAPYTIRNERSQKVFDSQLSLLAKASPAVRAEMRQVIIKEPYLNPIHQSIALAVLDNPEALEMAKKLLAGPIPEDSGEYTLTMYHLCIIDRPEFAFARELPLQYLDHADPFLARSSIAALQFVPSDTWRDAVLQRLKDPEYPHRATLVRSLDYLEADSTLVDTLAEAWRLRDPSDDTFQYIYRAKFRDNSQDAAIRQATDQLFAQMCREIPLANVQRWISYIDPAYGQDVLDAHLEAVQTGEVEPSFVEYRVLRELAVYDPEKYTPKLNAWLGNPHLADPAYQALAMLKRGSQDAEFAQRLYDHEMSKDTTYSRAASMLVGIGGEKAKELAVKFISQQKKPYLGIDDRWSLQGLTVEDVLQASVRHGLIESMPDDEIIRRRWLESSYGTSPHEHWIALLNETGAMTYFDNETDTHPNRHDELLMTEFKRASRGLFNPTRAIEVWDEYRHGYHVLFEESGRWYEFFADGYGDWFDTQSVVYTVNYVLAKNGHTERFHNVENNDQASSLICVDEAKLMAFAEEFGLPCGNVNDARERGLAAEASIRAQLGIEKPARKR